MTAALMRELEASGRRLSARVIDDMYAHDPFWRERFGDRGRRHAGEDGDFHIAHLVQALVANEPEVLIRYARWLQSVLTTRGMCSRHLDENFERLARAIQRETPDSGPAVAYLERARGALCYPGGPGRELQDAAARLTRATVEELCRRHSNWLAQHEAAERETWAKDVAYHLSYLADAAALGRTELFAAHAVWIGGFLQRRDVPQEHLVQCLEVIAQLVSRERNLSAAARALAGEALSAAVQRLAAKPAREGDAEVDQSQLLRKLRTISKPRSPARVLVIDADDRARYLLRKYLETSPYELLEASSGPEGIRCAREQRPHVILLDFLLIDMTAFDVLDELKADPRTRGIPVVIVTSHVLGLEEKRRLAAETEAILSKESLSRELAINRIRDALQKAGVGPRLHSGDSE